jgi:hypothetical protein
MMGAPLPPMQPEMPMGAPMAPPPMSPIDAVMAALQGLQSTRQFENDAVLSAVMKATGAGMPMGMEGVSEGAPFEAAAPMPAGPEMGAY